MKTVLTIADISQLIGAGKDKARAIKNEVNEFSKSKGRALISPRKCLALDFSELYGIPIEVIDRELDMKKAPKRQ